MISITEFYEKLYNIFIILCLCNNANCREYLGRVGFSDQASITPEKFDREGLNQNSDAQFLLIDILIVASWCIILTIWTNPKCFHQCPIL